MADTPVEKQTSYEEKVNGLVSQLVQGEDGTFTLPEDVSANLDEGTHYAVMAEKRRRDTQASFSKSQARLKQIEAENERLASSWQNDVAKNLTHEQQEELDELKATDPDAWRTKLNEYEQANVTKFQERRTTIKQEVQNETELERRTRLIEEHNEANPELALTDDVIENDLPPRMVKQLADGTIDFDTFIEKAVKYISTPKKLKGDDTDDDPSGKNLGKLGGSHKPEESAVDKAAKDNYENEVY